MTERLSGSMIMMAIASAAAIISVPTSPISAQAPLGSATAPAQKTPWGEPDLQGIWTDEFDTPLQRRVEDAAFAQGQGPDPATRDSVGALVNRAADAPQDPLQ